MNDNEKYRGKGRPLMFIGRTVSLILAVLKLCGLVDYSWIVIAAPALIAEVLIVLFAVTVTFLRHL